MDYLNYHIDSKCNALIKNNICKNKSKNNNGLCDLHHDKKIHKPSKFKQIFTNNINEKLYHLETTFGKSNKIPIACELFDILCYFKEILYLKKWVTLLAMTKSKLFEFSESSIGDFMLKRIELYQKYLFPTDFNLTLGDYVQIQEELNILN